MEAVCVERYGGPALGVQGTCTVCILSRVPTGLDTQLGRVDLNVGCNDDCAMLLFRGSFLLQTFLRDCTCTPLGIVCGMVQTSLTMPLGTLPARRRCRRVLSCGAFRTAFIFLNFG